MGCHCLDFAMTLGIPTLWYLPEVIVPVSSYLLFALLSTITKKIALRGRCHPKQGPAESMLLKNSLAFPQFLL